MSVNNILTLTVNPSLDVFTTIENLAPTIKLRCDAPQYDPGGGGINVARAIHTFGGDVVAHYVAGGQTGDQLIALLDRTGIAHCPTHLSQKTRESFIVVANSTGREYRFTFPGSVLTENEWRRFLDALSAHQPTPEFIVASGSLPPGVPENFYAKLTRRAHARGAKFILDTSGPSLRMALNEGVFLIKPNRREFYELMSNEGSDEECLAFAQNLIERGMTEIVTLTDGAGTAFLIAAETRLRVQPPAVELRSSVGAGDSFVAAFILSLASEKSLEEAFRQALAAGTAALLTPGTELCRKKDAENLIGGVEIERF